MGAEGRLAEKDRETWMDGEKVTGGRSINY